MRYTRAIYSNNGVLTDISTKLANYHNGTFTLVDFVAAEDYLYIGNVVPFNHFYLKMGTASVASTTMSIDYWGGNTWNSVVETIDETEGLTQDGYVTFVPDRDSGWTEGDTNGQGQSITGLTSVTIYDKYWIRVSLNNDLTDNAVISWIGNKFSDDNDLGSEFPDLVRASVITAFEAGKTDWEEQHVRAAEVIISDLIKKKIIFAKGQILDRNTFMLPSISKVSEIIYNAFGDDYEKNKKASKDEYTARIDKSIYDVDNNLDGELTPNEMGTRQGFMSR
jgi:hypothetical protein